MKKLIFTTILLGSIGISQAALTWSWGGWAGPQDKADAITYAMNTTVGNYNRYANLDGNIQVCYNSGVPTAQTDGYQGLISFGGSISARVAQHEIAHWLGCGTYWDWNNHRNGNQWTGSAANAQLAAYNGWGSTVGVDGLHFWPYGWNQDNEGPADHNISMVCAFRRDMGLSDGRGSYFGNGTYKIIARHSGKALDAYNQGTGNGTKIIQWPYWSGAGQKWTLYSDGNGAYYIQGVQSGKFLDIDSYAASNYATVHLWDGTGGFNQRYFIAATDSGYYRITPSHATGYCLDVYGVSTANGAQVHLWQWLGGANQQWSFQSP